MYLLEQFAAKWGVDSKRASDLGRPFTDNDISRIEDTLKVMLPAEFVDQMKTVGALWSPNILTAVCDAQENEHEDEDSEFDLHDLQNLLSAEQIIEETKGWHSAGMPLSLVAIGNDCMGNKFCFDKKDLGTPRCETAPIYFFDHDFDEVTMVAETFSEWIAQFMNLPISNDDDTE